MARGTRVRQCAAYGDTLIRADEAFAGTDTISVTNNARRAEILLPGAVPVLCSPNQPFVAPPEPWWI